MQRTSAQMRRLPSYPWAHECFKVRAIFYIVSLCQENGCLITEQILFMLSLLSTFCGVNGECGYLGYIDWSLLSNAAKSYLRLTTLAALAFHPSSECLNEIINKLLGDHCHDTLGGFTFLILLLYKVHQRFFFMHLAVNVGMWPLSPSCFLINHAVLHTTSFIIEFCKTLQPHWTKGSPPPNVTGFSSVPFLEK